MHSRSPSSAAQFLPTRWSVVLAAGQWRPGSSARAAIEQLAGSYWFPLYAYLRRKGNFPAQAEDLVQGFFARLLEKDVLSAADPARGKFRSFLLASLDNYLHNEWDKEHAQKRGGRLIHIDSIDAESRYAIEPVDDMTPERVFERRWALAMLDRVLSRLRDEYTQRGHQKTFLALEHVLVGGRESSNAQIAEQLGMTEGTVKVAGHRLRRRYRELLREEIAQTVGDASLIDDEIRQLLACL